MRAKTSSDAWNASRQWRRRAAGHSGHWDPCRGGSQALNCSARLAAGRTWVAGQLAATAAPASSRRQPCASLPAGGQDQGLQQGGPGSGQPPGPTRAPEGGDARLAQLHGGGAEHAGAEAGRGVGGRAGGQTCSRCHCCGCSCAVRQRCWSPGARHKMRGSLCLRHRRWAWACMHPFCTSCLPHSL